MQVKPDLAQFLELCRQYAYVPVWGELYNDVLTPTAAVQKFGQERVAYLLESVDGGEHVGRFSFLGLDPILKIKVSSPGKVTMERGLNKEEQEPENPCGFLAELLQTFKGPSLAELPRFYGGLVGYVGYDAVRYVEKIEMAEENFFPQVCLTLAEKLIIFDQVYKKLYLIILVEKNGGLVRYQEAVQELEVLRKVLLTREAQGNSAQSNGKVQVHSNISREDFMNMVTTAKEYIRAGDILQVVLSQRLEVTHRHSPFSIYRALRYVNPSPYLYYLNQGDFQIIGSSPEMLVRVEQGMIETRPIAGTRPRGQSITEDERLAHELLDDPKERAEHVMLVDLGRNDLGRVCKFGTVKVREFMEIEKFSHVMHIVSTVQGELCEGVSPLQALLACFPAGTVSGAPKVRAMQIIAELEPAGRGIYAGAVCYLGLNGTLDSCITIRSIINQGHTAWVQAGAGIVNDSDPGNEYEETLHKARGLLNAIAKAGEVETC